MLQPTCFKKARRKRAGGEKYRKDRACRVIPVLVLFLLLVYLVMPLVPAVRATVGGGNAASIEKPGATSPAPPDKSAPGPGPESTAPVPPDNTAPAPPPTSAPLPLVPVVTSPSPAPPVSSAPAPEDPGPRNVPEAPATMVAQPLDALPATDVSTFGSLACPRPAISIDKCGPCEACVGCNVVYLFTIRNTGDVPLCDISVTDPLLGGEIYTARLMLPGGFRIFARNYTVPEDAPRELENTAGVRARYLCDEVTDTDSHTVRILRPEIELEKSGPAVACTGDDITYTFTVTNTGNVCLINVKVKDPLFSTGDIACYILLPVGESKTFTRSYHVQPGDPDPLLNTASVTACSLCGPAGDEAQWSTDIGHPAIRLTKGGPAVACAGDEITYTYLVENIGDIELTNVQVLDSLIGAVGAPGTLAPGASETREAKYTVQQGDPSPILNTATATAASDCGDVTAEDDWSVEIIHPSITLKKSGPDVACVGDDITYDYVITNTGDVELESVQLTDSVIGDIVTIDSIPALGVESVSAVHTVTSGDPDPLVNTATVTAQSDCGLETAEDGWSVDIIHPAIQIVKGGPETATMGQAVTYTFDVTNNGDVGLTEVIVTDSIIGMVGSLDALPQGGSLHLDATRAVQATDPDPLVNTATVTGQAGGCAVSAQDSHTLDIVVTPAIPVGAISITKSPGSRTVQVGDTVSFTITVANAGQTFIPAPVQVTDTYDTSFLGFQLASPAPDSSADTGTLTWSDVSGGSGLAVGASTGMTVTFFTRQPGLTSNGAVVSAVDAFGMPLTGRSSGSVTIEPAPSPSVPTTPVTPATFVTTVETTPSTLPKTGDNMHSLFTVAWVLIPVGTVMLLAYALRRRRVRRVER